MHIQLAVELEALGSYRRRGRDPFEVACLKLGLRVPLFSWQGGSQLGGIFYWPVSRSMRPSQTTPRQAPLDKPRGLGKVEVMGSLSTRAPTGAAFMDSLRA